MTNSVRHSNKLKVILFCPVATKHIHLLYKQRDNEIKIRRIFYMYIDISAGACVCVCLVGLKNKQQRQR